MEKEELKVEINEYVLFLVDKTEFYIIKNKIRDKKVMNLPEEERLQIYNFFKKNKNILSIYYGNLEIIIPKNLFLYLEKIFKECNFQILILNEEKIYTIFLSKKNIDKKIRILKQKNEIELLKAFEISKENYYGKTIQIILKEKEFLKFQKIC